MKNLWMAIKNPVLTAAFVLTGLFLYSSFSYLLPFGNPISGKTTLFNAQGTAEATYVPDTALIYLGVNKTATTQEEAKNEANKVINQITADLKKLGVEEKNIKTTNFSVNQEYSYDTLPATEPAVDSKISSIIPPRTTKPKGYTANVSLEVRVKPLDKAEQVIDVVTAAGATQVGTSQLVLDEQKRKELEDKVLIEAINNAKGKAKEISKAAGIRLGRVVDVQQTNGSFPGPIYRTMDLQAEGTTMQALPPTELNPGENKISVSVNLSYETY